MNFIAIIPARFSSSRLPGKPLLTIHGKPMIVHVIEQARKSNAKRVIVATDHPAIESVVKAINGEVCMTRSNHNSGIERISEVLEHYQFSDETVVVNLQGDQPMIPPEIINQVATNIQLYDVNIATMAAPITSIDEALNPNIVKVVRDLYGYALYFSRATIPFHYKPLSTKSSMISKNFLRHIGVYSYHARLIRKYIRWNKSPLESIESLEQLRILSYGEKIHVDITTVNTSNSIDTPEDLMRIRTAEP
ncbi:3-deoxy-manno-octulosonate cytidylyltransferase [Candidatus Erwinia haradaeae]|uniref:3-deoxy-manno-octulosonate cytidylyltransferase n=1 Tax=Candidatus Erwinia haradaeae TaxID=1922217 RepID=A0A451D0E5_9GAMM|nr:3-deoxy-manno-octulosonate cytidylyltransferase [Candidatus Erwinia haradaeae]VFP78903.1 3-deoxy-manno-octulosonate cytidylyltransferase [Candidatus Erwinia haradaeae]